MDKFITTNRGGLPFNLDDINFLNDNLVNMIKGLLDSQQIESGAVGDTTDRFVWSGGFTYFSPSVFNYQKSIVYDRTNDELFFIDSGSLTGSFSTMSDVKVVLDESWDPDGYKLFKDGDTFPVRKFRRLKFSESTTNQYGGCTLDTLYKSLKFSKAVAVGTGGFSDRAPHRMGRWKTEKVSSNYRFSGDTYRDVGTLIVSGSSGAVTIETPGESIYKMPQVEGETIKIFNRSNYTVTINNRVYTVGTLSSNEACEIYCDGTSWFLTGKWTVSG